MADRVVKSVGRVFEIFELFNLERRPLAAIDIARKLRFPLTSTHAILKSMCTLGYMSYRTSARTYFPTSALPNTIDWLRDTIQGEVEIINFLSAVSRATHETINLSRRVDTQVQIVFGLESTHTVGVSVSMGTRMPVTRSLTGIVSLAKLKPKERADFFQSLELSDPLQYDELDIGSVESTLRSLRRKGTVTRCDLYVRGIGATCLPLEWSGTDEPYVLGIVGPSDRITAHCRDHKRILADLVQKFSIRTVFPLRSN